MFNWRESNDARQLQDAEEWTETQVNCELCFHDCERKKNKGWAFFGHFVPEYKILFCYEVFNRLLNWNRLLISIPAPIVIFSCWSLNSGVRYPGFLIEWIFCWIEPSQIQNFESIFELNFPGKKIIECFSKLNIPEKMILNNPLNWILSWNEWMNHSWIDICHFWWKVPFFVYFGHFLGNFWALFLFDQY